MPPIGFKPTPEAIQKNKRFRRIFMILIIFIGAGLITWGIIVLIKKNKEKKALADNSGSGSASSNTLSSGSGSASGSVSAATPGNIKAVQNAINAAHPDAKLEVDGVMGPLTKAAIIKYYGASALPLTENSLQMIITGTSPGKPAIGYPAATNQGGDNFPLKIGSKGNLVTGLKNMVALLAPQFKVNMSDDVFGNDLYTAINTGIGTKYYPVTDVNYTAIANLYNTKHSA